MQRVAGEMTPVVDCDVHEAYPSIDVLLPYVADPWRRYFTECGFRDIPRGPYVESAHGGRRADAWPSDGGPPGSDYALMREQLFDQHHIDYAILVGHFYRASAMPQAAFATALASAYNDWLIDTWLPKDTRFRGSVQIAMQDPEAAAREIDRVGGHPNMVQVIIPSVSERGFGHPSYYPIYEAATRNGLPVCIHPTPSTGIYPPPTVVGSWPRTYMEFHANFALAYQAQVMNLVCEGVFEKFPTLRFMLLEAGFAWLPHVMWSLDTHWKSLQLEVPWLKRPPSEYVLEHFRVGTQPIIVPDDTKHFEYVLEIVHGDQLLVFASDYAHWDFDSPQRFLPPSIGAETRKRIMGLNALEFYGLPTPSHRVDGETVPSGQLVQP